MTQNNKKRKYNQMVSNLGFGLHDDDKAPGMREIEQQLHFLKHNVERSGPPKEYEVISIQDKTN